MQSFVPAVTIGARPSVGGPARRPQPHAGDDTSSPGFQPLVDAIVDERDSPHDRSRMSPRTAAATPRAAGPAAFVRPTHQAGRTDAPPHSTDRGDGAEAGDAAKAPCVQESTPAIDECAAPARETAGDTVVTPTDIAAPLVPTDPFDVRRLVDTAAETEGDVVADGGANMSKASGDSDAGRPHAVSPFARAAMAFAQLRAAVRQNGGASSAASVADERGLSAGFSVETGDEGPQTGAAQDQLADGVVEAKTRAAGARLAEALAAAGVRNADIRRSAAGGTDSSEGSRSSAAGSLTTLFTSSVASVQGESAGAPHAISGAPAPHLALSSTSGPFAGAMASATTGAALGSSDVPSEASLQEIVRAIRMQAIQGGGEAEIRLEPRHFGELTISIRVEQGQVMARLQVESPAVREWLQTNQGVLRQQLAEQQLTLDRFEVAPPDESRASDRRGSWGGGAEERQRDRRPRKDDPNQSFEVVA